MSLSPRFSEALVYATQLHNNQVRKGSGTPYVAHLIGVASLVLEAGGDEDEAIAGLLHDAIEDQGGLVTRDIIKEKFGDRVTEIVEGCTDSFTTPKPPWKARKEAYLEHLKTASPSIRLVSLADKLYNARSIVRDYYQIGDDLWDRFQAKKDGTLWYYRALIDIFETIDDRSIVGELKRTIIELETLVS